MGGAIGLGNWTPAAEFNIIVDPEAAAIIFNSGIRVNVIPLEVSHTVLITE
jgi:inosine-uridine nucleoside N-ribohydrolase